MDSGLRFLTDHLLGFLSGDKLIKITGPADLCQVGPLLFNGSFVLLNKIIE